MTGGGGCWEVKGRRRRKRKGRGEVTLEPPLIILSIIDRDVMSVCTCINILCMLSA